MTLPTYPKDVLDSPDGWVRLIGNFWEEHFKQPEVILAIARWLEASREQLTQDLAEAKKSVSVDTLPVFHREWWMPITFNNIQSGEVLKYGNGASYGGELNNITGVNNIYAYGTRSSPFGKFRSYALPDNVVNIGSITDSPAAPSFYWLSGIDITVDIRNRQILVPYDLFEDPKFSDIVVVKPNGVKELNLWAFCVDVDWRHGYVHAGHLLDIDIPSSMAANKLLAAVWKSSITGGSDLKQIHELFLAITGLSSPSAKETVITVTRDGDIPVVCTDKSIYRLPRGATTRVGPGDVVDVGSSLVADAGTYISPRAYYPWDNLAIREPELPPKDVYDAISIKPEPIPEVSYPAIRITPSTPETFDKLTAASPSDVESVVSSQLYQDVVSLPIQLDLPTTTVQPVVAPVAQQPIPTERPTFDPAIQLNRPASNAYISVHGHEDNVTPRGLFDGLPAARGIMTTATSNDYIYFDPKSGAYYETQAVTDKQATERGWQKLYVGERGLPARYVFPDVHFGIHSNIDRGPYLETQGLPNKYDGPFPPQVPAADIFISRARFGRLIRFSIRGNSLSYPYTYKIRVTGGIIPQSIYATGPLAGGNPHHQKPVKFTRLDGAEYLVTVNDDGTVDILYDIADKTDTVDINDPPAVIPVGDVAYRQEYTGGVSPPAETVGQLVADLVVPGGVGSVVEEQRTLYRQLAARLLPTPAVVKAGKPRVLLLSSHPSTSNTVLASTIQAATGYPVDTFYAWELRRGISTSPLYVAGGGPIRSFVDMSAAVNAGVRSIKFIPSGSKQRAVYEVSQYALVVWDSSGGIADLPEVAQTAYTNGFAPGDSVQRVTSASSAYAWKVPDSARIKYQGLLSDYKREYDAANSTATVASTQADGLPSSDPKVKDALTKRLIAQRKLEDVRRVEREYQLDCRLWGLHAGVIEVLATAQRKRVGIMFTGGTLARDLDVLDTTNQARLLSLLGVKVIGNTTIAGVQGVVVTDSPVYISDKTINSVLPTETGVQPTTATSVIDIQGGGSLVTAVDSDYRAVLCNYRLVDSPTGVIPIGSGTQIVDNPARINFSSILTSTNVDIQSEPRRLLGTFDFYTSLPVLQLDGYSSYLKYANAARALDEYILPTSLDEDIIDVSESVQALLNSVDYSGNSITVSAARNIVNTLYGQAILVASNIQSDDVTYVKPQILNRIPDGLSVRYIVKVYCDTYATIPEWVGIYDKADERTVLVGKNYVKLDCPGSLDLVYETTKIITRVEVEYNQVPTGISNVRFINEQFYHYTEWYEKLNQTRIAKLVMGDNPGTGVLSDGYAPDVEFEVGTWDDFDTRVRDVTRPGRILVKTSSVSRLAASDVIYDAPTGTGFGIAQLPPANVIDLGRSFVVEPKSMRVVGYTAEVIYNITTSFSLGGSVRKFNTQVSTREPVVALSYGAGALPYGAAIAPLEVASVYWKTYNTDTGVIIQEGYAGLNGSTWAISPNVDLIQTEDAAYRDAGKVAFKVVVTFNDNSTLESTPDLWPTAAGDDTPLFGVPEATQVGGGTFTFIDTIPTEVIEQIQVIRYEEQKTPGTLSGKILKLPTGLTQLPENPETIYPEIGTVSASSWDVSPRDWRPGMFATTGEYEWFALVYEGVSNFDVPGDYTFYAISDDGVRLFINGKKILDDTYLHAPRKTQEVTVRLPAGVLPVRVEYWQGPRYRVACQIYVKKPDAKREYRRQVFDVSIPRTRQPFTASPYLNEAGTPAANYVQRQFDFEFDDISLTRASQVDDIILVSTVPPTIAGENRIELSVESGFIVLPAYGGLDYRAKNGFKLTVGSRTVNVAPDTAGYVRPGIGDRFITVDEFSGLVRNAGIATLRAGDKLTRDQLTELGIRDTGKLYLTLIPYGAGSVYATFVSESVDPRRNFEVFRIKEGNITVPVPETVDVTKVVPVQVARAVTLPTFWTSGSLTPGQLGNSLKVIGIAGSRMLALVGGKLRSQAATYAVIGTSEVTVTVPNVVEPYAQLDVPALPNQPIIDPTGLFIFVIDTSNSMNKPGRLDAAKVAMLETLNTLTSETLISIISFTSTATVVVEPTKDKATIATGIRSLTAAGGTSLTAAINKLNELLESNTYPSTVQKKVAMVLSDGISSNVRKEILIRVSQNQCEVDVVYFNTKPQDITKSMRELADYTGGTVYSSFTQDQLNRLNIARLGRISLPNFLRRKTITVVVNCPFVYISNNGKNTAYVRSNDGASKKLSYTLNGNFGTVISVATIDQGRITINGTLSDNTFVHFGDVFTSRIVINGLRRSGYTGILAIVGNVTRPVDVDVPAGFGSELVLNGSNTFSIYGNTNLDIRLNGNCRLNVSGNVTGDIRVNGGTLYVSGNVTGNIRTNGSNASIRIGGNLVGNVSGIGRVDVVGNFTGSLGSSSVYVYKNGTWVDPSELNRYSGNVRIGALPVTIPASPLLSSLWPTYPTKVGAEYYTCLHPEPLPALDDLDEIVFVPFNSNVSGNLLNNTTGGDGSYVIKSFEIAGTSGTIIGVLNQAMTIPDVGEIIIGSSGDWAFSSKVDFSGPVPAITYVVDDQNGQTNTSELRILVDAPPPAPPLTTRTTVQSIAGEAGGGNIIGSGTVDYDGPAAIALQIPFEQDIYEKFKVSIPRTRQPADAVPSLNEPGTPAAHYVQRCFACNLDNIRLNAKSYVDDMIIVSTVPPIINSDTSRVEVSLPAGFVVMPDFGGLDYRAKNGFKLTVGSKIANVAPDTAGYARPGIGDRFITIQEYDQIIRTAGIPVLNVGSTITKEQLVNAGVEDTGMLYVTLIPFGAGSIEAEFEVRTQIELDRMHIQANSYNGGLSVSPSVPYIDINDRPIVAGTVMSTGVIDIYRAITLPTLRYTVVQYMVLRGQVDFIFRAGNGFETRVTSNQNNNQNMVNVYQIGQDFPCMHTVEVRGDADINVTASSVNTLPDNTSAITNLLVSNPAQTSVLSGGIIIGQIQVKPEFVSGQDDDVLVVR